MDPIEIDINLADEAEEIEVVEIVVETTMAAEVDDPSNLPSSEPSPSQDHRYISALVEFNKWLSKFRPLIPSISKWSRSKRAQYLESTKLDGLLLQLQTRPRNIPFKTVQGIDELKSFCDAISVRWWLWPGYSLGLIRLVDHLADKTLAQDIARLHPNFLLALKEIATHKEWTDMAAALCGGELSAQAKKILFRHKNATRKPVKVAAAAVCEALRICEGVDCHEIESFPDQFPRCGRCRKVFYHSKRCQATGWLAGHRDLCKPPATE